MKRITFIICFLAVTFSIAAQNNPAINQATTTQQQRDTARVSKDFAPGETVPSLYAEEDADVGPQTVLRKKKPTWFRASVDAQVSYTDNLLYEFRDKEDGGVAVTTLEAALTTPPCITKLASYRAEVGYRHQFFNYFGHENVFKTFDADDFDFDSSTVFANVLAQTKHYQFRAGIDYTRLLGFEPFHNHDYEEFYREVVPRWSIQRNFRMGAKTQLSLAYLGSYHFTREDQPVTFGFPVGSQPEDRSERWEQTVIAIYSIALPAHFVAQPYYRFQYSDFVNRQTLVTPGGRRERFYEALFLHTVGGSLGWFPCENFSARVFAGYNWQEAAHRWRDNTSPEYERLDIGAGATATLRF